MIKKDRNLDKQYFRNKELLKQIKKNTTNSLTRLKILAWSYNTKIKSNSLNKRPKISKIPRSLRKLKKRRTRS